MTLFLLVLLSAALMGCAANTTIQKDVYVCAGNDVMVNYITNVDIKITADTQQEFKDLLKAVPQ